MLLEAQHQHLFLQQGAFSTNIPGLTQLKQLTPPGARAQKKTHTMKPFYEDMCATWVYCQTGY